MKRIIALTAVFAMLAAPLCTAESGPDTGLVKRANFSSDIHEREPVDNLTELVGNTEQVYFFTELRDLAGQVVVHSWEYQGESVAEVRFKVSGPRWRVWSSKTLTPDRHGTWTVLVLNAAGEILAEKALDYNPRDPAL
ncbi:MAG: DUF2914 domain-containing protein [Gammaproteobacteria bacterium]|nr:DUF2914 domain-containing protein [Gammaproteobacteria bacterium]MDH3561370.1 DUF2914 domain-containing protein [Gammaproteobacteria bacterium]